MSDPIDELELEHGEILRHLLRIRAADYRRDVALTAMRWAQDVYLRHVERENRLVIRPLLDDPAQAATTGQYRRQIQVLTREVLAFVDRFGRSDSPPYGIEFAMELGRLTQRLRHRMHYEEATLYPLVRSRARLPLVSLPAG